MSSGIGNVSKVLSLPLRYMGRLCRKGSNANNVLTLGEETL